MENETIKERQDKNKNDIIDQLRRTPIIEIACKKVGIGRATFYRWRKDDERFAQEVERALDEGLSLVSDLAESKLVSAIQGDNLSAIIFWLKHRHIAYGNKVEISGQIKAESKALTPEQEILLKKAIDLALINDKKYEHNDKPTTD